MFSCERRSVRRTTLLNFVLNKCNGVALYQSVYYVLQQLCRQSKLKYSSSSVLLGALSLYLNHTLAWHIHGEQPRLVALVVSFICIFFFSHRLAFNYHKNSPFTAIMKRRPKQAKLKKPCTKPIHSPFI